MSLKDFVYSIHKPGDVLGVCQGEILHNPEVYLVMQFNRINIDFTL